MQKPILSTEEFQNLWLNQLTESQRRTRIEKAFGVVRKVAEKQLGLFEEAEKNQSTSKDIRFLYLQKTLQGVWENADFVIALGKTKYQEYSFYPVRMIMENTFRLEYFSRRKKDQQIEIAAKEMLRIAKRFYDFEKNNGEDGREYKNFYEFFATGIDIPDIDSVNERDLDPFPSMRELTRNTKIEGGSSWYFHYQSLAELTHGKLMSFVITKDEEVAEHRRSLMYLQTMCHDVLKNGDFHLGGKTRNEVVAAIEEAERIVKKPLNTFQTISRMGSILLSKWLAKIKNGQTN